MFLDVANLAEQDVQAIRRYLRKEPRSLPFCIWKPLRRYGLVRTPEEQRRHLLDTAVNSDLAPTRYSIAVQRTLRAALALDAKTSKLQLVFKSGVHADLDLLIDESNVIINDKWLDFTASHAQHSCWISDEGIALEEFPCDHVINYLHDLVLKQLKPPYCDQEVDVEFRMRLGSKASQHFHQMPRSIEIRQGTELGELIVVWSTLECEDFYRRHGLKLNYRIVLHRQSTCHDRKEELLLSAGE